jgi:hypothetical protein
MFGVNDGLSTGKILREAVLEGSGAKGNAVEVSVGVGNPNVLS